MHTPTAQVKRRRHPASLPALAQLVTPPTVLHPITIRTMSCTPPTLSAVPSRTISCHLCDCLCLCPRPRLSYLRPCNCSTSRIYPTAYRLCLGLPTRYFWFTHAVSSSLPRCLPSRPNEPSRPYSSLGSQTFSWLSPFHMLARRPLR